MTVQDLPQFDVSDVRSYEEAQERVTWDDLPSTFNMGTAVVDRWAHERGRVALFWNNPDGPDETVTFWQYRRRCDRFGNLLRDLGLEPGDRLGVFLPQRPETITAHAGCWRAGCVSIPLPSTFEFDSIRYRLHDAGARALVLPHDHLNTLRGLVDEIEALEYLLVVGGEEGAGDSIRHWASSLADYDPSFEPVATEPDDEGIIIYTSGTTGQPKGGVHGHRILLGHLPGYQFVYNLSMEGVYYTPADWGWGGGLIDLVTAGMYHGQPVVGTDRGKFVPEEHFDLMDRYGVTHSFMPPTALNMLREADDSVYDLSLEVLAAGGEALSTDAYKWADDRDIVINEFYGQTEANFLVANCEAVWGSKPGSMGRAMPGRDVDVIDDNGNRLPSGEVGEVALEYPHEDPIWFKEYLDKPEETASVLLNDEWHLTEDLARKDETGYFWYESRKDDVIISSGYRISPVTVEDAIMKYEAVAEAAVVGVSHETRGEIVKAFVKLRPGEEPSEVMTKAIQDWVKDTLAKHEYPRELEFVEEFPTTESDKIRRKDLRKRERDA
jgi:acetyl-CoA synthetase